MKRNTDRIQTTHAGSLPRPDDLTRLMWDSIDGKPVDKSALAKRVTEAVRDVVRQQRAAGIDIVSDGEMSKIGFSNYVIQRFSGFGERAQFMATDLVEVNPEQPQPEVIERAAAAVRDDQHEWKKINAGLEDVFISLMETAKDNFA